MLTRLLWRLRKPRLGADQARNMGLDTGWETRSHFEDAISSIRTLGFRAPPEILRYAVWIEHSAVWTVAFRVAHAKGADESVLDRVFDGFQAALRREVAADIKPGSPLASKYDGDVAALAEALWEAVGRGQAKLGWEIGKALVIWYRGAIPGAQELIEQQEFGITTAMGARVLGSVAAQSKFLGTCSSMA